MKMHEGVSPWLWDGRERTQKKYRWKTFVKTQPPLSRMATVANVQSSLTFVLSRLPCGTGVLSIMTIKPGSSVICDVEAAGSQALDNRYAGGHWFIQKKTSRASIAPTFIKGGLRHASILKETKAGKKRTSCVCFSPPCSLLAP